MTPTGGLPAAVLLDFLIGYHMIERTGGVEVDWFQPKMGHPFHEPILNQTIDELFKISFLYAIIFPIYVCVL